MVAAKELIPKLAFVKGEEVRINREGSEMHGKLATVQKDVMKGERWVPVKVQGWNSVMLEDVQTLVL